MLQLIIDNQIVDLDSALNLTFRNPIFDRNGLPKGYSYPFNFAWTDTNRKIFGNSNRLDSKTLNKKYAAELQLFSQTSVTGYFYVTFRDKKGGKGYFLNESRDIAKRLEGITTKTLLDEPNLVPNINPAVFTYSLTNGTYTSGDIIRIRINEYDFQFFVGSVFVSAPYEPADYILNLIKSTIENPIIGKFDVNEVDVTVTNVGSTATITITPTIYCGEFYVQVNYDSGSEPYPIFDLTIISERFQYVAISEAIADFRLDLLDAGTHLFPYFKNIAAYKDRNDFSGHFNRMNDTPEYIENGGFETKGLFQYTASPFVKLSHLFNLITSYLGFSWSGLLPNDLAIDDVLFFNPKTIDLEIKDQGDLYFNVFNAAYNLKDHVPDLDAANIFAIIKDSFFVYFELNNGVLTIKHIASKLNENAINLTPYIENDYGYETPEINSFEVIMEKEDNDSFINASLVDYTQGDATESHEMADTTYSEIRQEQDSSFGVRLVKYLGIDADDQPAITAYDTPTAAYNNNRTFFKYLFNSKTIKVQATLPPHILLKLITFENPILRLETEDGNVQGVLESINFKMTANKMSKVNLEIRVI